MQRLLILKEIIISARFKIIFKRKLQAEDIKRTRGTLNGTLKDVLTCVKKSPGIQANQISAILKKPIDTIKKQIKTLADKGLIERKGSRKSGGYHAK